MRFLNLLLLASIATLICACEKNFQSEMLSEGQQTSQTRVQPNILSFSSIEEMENQIRALIEMESDDREAWYAERNFESQYDALYRAAEEIDRAATLSDAEAIKEKYREFFLYNDNPEDEELFNPYLPNEKSSYAYVCNIRGEVQIGNEIHNFNTITDVRNTKEFQRFHEVETRGVETHSNYLKSTVGKSKFWAEGRLDGNEVVAIEFTAHKKGLFGWNKYKTAYYVRVQRYSRTWESFSPDFMYYINSGTNGLWTRELKSHTLVPVGRLAYHQTATMDSYIYSRGTGEAGAGVLRLNYTSSRGSK